MTDTEHSLPYVLRLLAGLYRAHLKAAAALADEADGRSTREKLRDEDRAATELRGAYLMLCCFVDAKEADRLAKEAHTLV